MKAFKIQKLACNHCTGWIWAEKAAAAGVPVVKGTDKYKSYKDEIDSLKVRYKSYLTKGE